MKDTLNILKTIISIPSYVDDDNNEINLIKYIKNFVKENAKNLHIKEQLVESGRYNLIIIGSENISTIIFAHMDTVLPKQETVEPFNPRIEDGKLYGLGSVDMKAGVAIMLDIIKNHHRSGVGYIFTVDEEYDFKGAFKLKTDFNLKPNIIINVEPTSLKILNGCRGITEFNFVVNGKSAHAGLKNVGINAIEKGVELVSKLQSKVSEFDSKDRGSTTVNLAYLKGGMYKGKDSDGRPILSELGMVVPNYAYINCEIRVASDKISEKYIRETINTLAESLDVTVSDIRFKFYLGSFFTDKKHLSEFEEAIKSVDKKVEYGDVSVAGYYEVQLLQELSESTCVVFGPGPIEMSHAANEYVLLDSVYDAQKVIESYIDAKHTSLPK